MNRSPLKTLTVALIAILAINIAATALIGSLLLQQTLLTVAALFALNAAQVKLNDCLQKKNKIWVIFGSDCIKFILIIAVMFFICPPTDENNKSGALLYCIDYMMFQAAAIYAMADKE